MKKIKIFLFCFLSLLFAGDLKAKCNFKDASYIEQLNKQEHKKIEIETLNPRKYAENFIQTVVSQPKK